MAKSFSFFTCFAFLPYTRNSEQLQRKLKMLLPLSTAKREVPGSTVARLDNNLILRGTENTIYFLLFKFLDALAWRVRVAPRVRQSRRSERNGTRRKVFFEPNFYLISILVCTETFQISFSLVLIVFFTLAAQSISKDWHRLCKRFSSCWFTLFYYHHLDNTVVYCTA